MNELFQRSVWAGQHLHTHVPATPQQMDGVLSTLQLLSPQLTELKVDAGSINNYPELKKVLDNHSRGSAYMRQYFKEPLVRPCDCQACRKGVWRPLLMPVAAYQELSQRYALPLPVPKPQPTTGPVSELHYMSLMEALDQPFTDEYQPSKTRTAGAPDQDAGGQRLVSINGVAVQTREANVTSGLIPSNVLQATKVRSIVTCKDCMKPLSQAMSCKQPKCAQL